MSFEQLENPKLYIYLQIVKEVEKLCYWWGSEGAKSIYYGSNLITFLLIAEKLQFTLEEIQTAKSIGRYRGLKRRKRQENFEQR